MMLEVMQYLAAALWIIAALLWVRNQIRIKKAITELNREVTRLKESENEQSIAREILSAKIAVNERTTPPLTADAGGSVRPDQKCDSEV